MNQLELIRVQTQRKILQNRGVSKAVAESVAVDALLDAVVNRAQVIAYQLLIEQFGPTTELFNEREKVQIEQRRKDYLAVTLGNGFEYVTDEVDQIVATMIEENSKKVATIEAQIDLDDHPDEELINQLKIATAENDGLIQSIAYYQKNIISKPISKPKTKGRKK